MNSPPFTPPPRGEPKGGVKVITLTGREAFAEVEDALTRESEACAAGPPSRHLLLDFTRVQWITSAELGTLILLHKRLTADGGRLTLINLRDEIYEVFTATRLHTLLEICR